MFAGVCRPLLYGHSDCDRARHATTTTLLTMAQGTKIVFGDKYHSSARFFIRYTYNYNIMISKKGETVAATLTLHVGSRRGHCNTRRRQLANLAVSTERSTKVATSQLPI